MQGIYRHQERTMDFNRLNKKELEIYGGERGIHIESHVIHLQLVRDLF
jgi:hypothetical protein